MADRSTGTFTSAKMETERHRHWSRESQTYAPADVLLHQIRSGWSLEPLAAVETFFYAGYRRVDVYYFTLRRGDETLEMPVLANPAVKRLIEQHKLTVLRVNAAREELE